MRRGRRSGRGSAPEWRAERKDDDSPVTLADRAAEAAMRELLVARFPEHGIVGEEAGEDRPGAQLRWVLDPIDGNPRLPHRPANLRHAGGAAGRRHPGAGLD